MATDSLRVSTVIQANTEQIYEAWLDSEQHARMTGGPASIDRAPGGRFSAWDGYIQGTTLEVEPGRRIVQSWRTAEFPADSPDSRVEIHLAPHESGGSLITVVHADIPEGDGPKYKEGWDKFYFGPMKDHFAKVAQGDGREAGAPDAGGGGGDVAEAAPDAGGGGGDVAEAAPDAGGGGGDVAEAAPDAGGGGGDVAATGADADADVDGGGEDVAAPDADGGGADVTEDPGTLNAGIPLPSIHKAPVSRSTKPATFAKKAASKKSAGGKKTAKKRAGGASSGAAAKKKAAKKAAPAKAKAKARATPKATAKTPAKRKSTAKKAAGKKAAGKKAPAAKKAAPAGRSAKKKKTAPAAQKPRAGAPSAKKKQSARKSTRPAAGRSKKGPASKRARSRA
jgi:uncharacterized protein YndB with AHSA1/START domain